MYIGDIINKLRLRHRKDVEILTMSPERDWIVIVSAFFILSILSLIINYYLFMYFTDISDVGIAEETPLESVDRPALRRMIDEFEKRKIDPNNYANSKIPVIDPSL